MKITKTQLKQIIKEELEDTHLDAGGELPLPRHKDQEDYDDYDDSMDGDFDSAMASAGYGTDEDYGYYGDE